LHVLKDEDILITTAISSAFLTTGQGIITRTASEDITAQTAD